MKSIKRKKSNKNKIYIIIFALLIVIGFAALSVNINTLVRLIVRGSGASNVYIDNIRLGEDTTIFDIPTKVNNTTLSYDVRLENLDDKLEFYFDIVNDGDETVIIDEYNFKVYDEGENLIDLPNCFKINIDNMDYVLQYNSGSVPHEGVEAHDRVTFKAYIGYNDALSKEDLERDYKLHIELSYDFIKGDITGYDRIEDSNYGNICVANGGRVDGYNNNITYTGDSNIVCVRAKELHTESCKWGAKFGMSVFAEEEDLANYGITLEEFNRNPYNYTQYYGREEYGCYNDGYTIRGTRETNTITYGSCGTRGKLEVGDAFDCDINGDGIYDGETERFYYVSPRDGDPSSAYATLIYSFSADSRSNMSNNRGYLPSSENPHLFGTEYGSYPTGFGMENASNWLPTITEWPNVSLVNETRQIADENDRRFCQYTFRDRAARLMAYNELTYNCNGFSLYDNQCNFILENTAYAIAGESSVNRMEGNYILLETLSTGGKPWVFNVADRNLEEGQRGLIKPVIEVRKDRIAY